jgi:hypothetical protein
MNTQNLIDLAKNIDPNVKETDIILLHGGYSSKAYKIDVGDNSHVLLVQKEGAVSSSNYGHTFAVLKLLDSVGYKHSPKAIWLHPEEKAIAITYFDGKASDKFDFNASSVDPKELSLRVIDAILDTLSIPMDKYENFCEKYDVKPLPVETVANHAERIGTNWFSIVEKSCPDKKIVEWLRPRIARSLSIARSLDQNKPSLGIMDPSNPNILINDGGDFMLIDWDSSLYNTEGPEFYISYTTHLTDFMKPFKEEIIEHVAKRLGTSPNDLAKKVYEHQYYYQIFDVNWAAMMMAKVNAGETKGEIDEFKKIAEERIIAYEKAFEI